MNTPQIMNMRDGTVVSEKMEPIVPPLVCRDVKATKRRFNPSNGSSFQNTGTEIRIPISGQFILDNKNVNVNFNLNSNQVCNVDFSVAGLFSQIRVEAGTGSSIVLESIDDPGVWANFLYQYTWTHEDMARENSKQRSSANQPGPARAAQVAIVAQGVGTGANGQTATTAQTAQAAITARLAGVLDKVGDSFNGDIEVALDLSLFMGIFSASAGLPLYDTAGVTIVLTLNNPTNSIYSATAPVLILSKIYATATCLEGGESYEKKLKELKSSGNKEISVMYNTCRRYIQSQPQSAATTGTFLINERSKSCLGFVAIGRDVATITKADSFSNSNSLFPVFTRFEYNIAGMSYPVAGINTISEATDETYDVYSQLSRRHDSGGLISRTQATAVLAVDAATQTAAMDSQLGPSQVLSINLSKCGPNEDYWGKGMNLSGSNLTNYLQVQYTPFNAQTINIYSIFQMKLHIDALGNFSTEF